MSRIRAPGAHGQAAWIRPGSLRERWQWQPTTTVHDPNPPITLENGGAAFPAQFFGLKAFFQGAIKDLCLVASADAPIGMGGQLFVRKGVTTYAVYLVETGDANASPMRVRTSTGTKAIRNKT